MARRKRFNSEKAALSFAKKVYGKVNDLREIKEAKSPFTVTYQSTEKTKIHGQAKELDWCPEEGRDFGYPNEYWQ
ncbi:MAG: hypothetical protein IIB08_02620 [Bacteroidetes bacterium]|nr:hypothetical protein [Bacteroidota bacterium]